MSFNLGIIGYVPPPKPFLNPQVFLENINKFKHTHPLVLYSEHPWPGCITLPLDPEKAIPQPPPRMPDGRVNKFALNNLLFFTGLRVALRHGFSHIIYLESDCRVGRDDWDAIMAEEYFSHPRPLVCGGSAVVYNPCNAGVEAADRWVQYVSNNSRRNFPIPTYGYKGAAEHFDSAVFPNGALGIYDMAWMQKFFDLNNSIELACKATAWDMQLGFELWKHFGVMTYDVVLHLKSIYSSYGDELTTEHERMSMLRRGDVVGVHQVKSGIGI